MHYCIVSVSFPEQDELYHLQESLSLFQEHLYVFLFNFLFCIYSVFINGCEGFWLTSPSEVLIDSQQ